MWQLEVLRRPTAVERAAVDDLVADVGARTGRRPLSDAHWVELSNDSAVGVAAHDPRHPHGIVAWAQYAATTDGWSLEVVARHDAAAGGDVTQLSALVERALAEMAADGCDRVRWWTFDPVSAAAALTLGFVEERALHQMHIGLPAADRTDVTTRPFEVGRDEPAWLEVNNAAFSWHGEQGGWDLATLLAREAEPWFDPDGFLLHEHEGRLVAFCWTKIHHDLSPVTGEIYVIAVHPDAHGRGLGRALTLAGLQHIEAGGVHAAMLYVDRDNTSAVALYHRIGFIITRTDHAFVRAPARAETDGTDTHGSPS